LLPEQYVIFAGRRWQVVSVDDTDKVIVVTPSSGGKPPLFDGGGMIVHDRVRQEIRKVLSGDEIPAFLDPTAKMLLVEAREAYQATELSNALYTQDGNSLILMNWRGDWVNNALAMFLTALGCSSTNEGLTIRITAESLESISPLLKRIGEASPAELLMLVGKAKNLQCEKWDWALPNDLLVKSFATARLDITGAQNEAVRFLNAGHS
jgi:ATP-dependent Lhr-like helicase